MGVRIENLQGQAQQSLGQDRDLMVELSFLEDTKIGNRAGYVYHTVVFVTVAVISMRKLVCMSAAAMIAKRSIRRSHILRTSQSALKIPSALTLLYPPRRIIVFQATSVNLAKVDKLH